MVDNINLVDEKGNRIGFMEKLEVHRLGKLHEAFSIFVFNKRGDLLLQRRASDKYHSGGLWTNTCCSHPRAEEDRNLAVHRRLKEEMGFDCDLQEVGSFVYKAPNLKNDLIEYEFDYVFVGQVVDVLVLPNKGEVCEYKWIKLDELDADIKNNPQNYTEWLKIILQDRVFKGIFMGVFN